MKQRIIILTIIFITAASIIYFLTIPKPDKWIYDKLPNNYQLEKVSETKLILGINESGKTMTKKNKKKVGIEDYIAEFSYGKNTISLKCARNNNGEIEVYFYIVDTASQEVYGPYENEETYQEVKEKLIKEELGNWLKTNQQPN